MAPPPEAGHTWTWTAFDSDSKLLLSWLVGPRTYDIAFDFMMDIRFRCSSIKQTASDGRYAYEGAVEDVFDDKVDFGQLIKPSTTDSPFDVT